MFTVLNIKLSDEYQFVETLLAAFASKAFYFKRCGNFNQ